MSVKLETINYPRFDTKLNKKRYIKLSYIFNIQPHFPQMCTKMKFIIST